jgi:hypothetical protein
MPCIIVIRADSTTSLFCKKKQRYHRFPCKLAFNDHEECWGNARLTKQAEHSGMRPRQAITSYLQWQEEA